MASGQARILVVDDEEATRTFVKSLFTDKSDYTVAEAPSGEDALVLIENGDNFDVILLDIMMPGLDGFEVLSILKNNPQTESINVIMFSAMNDLAGKLRAFSEGASDYIAKPFVKAELIARVDTQVRFKQVKDELRTQCDQLDKMVRERTAALTRANETLRREITDHRQAEKRLLESERKYRDLVERANDGIAIIQDTLLKYINPRLAEMTGYKVEDTINSSFLDYIYPDELPKVADYYQRRMSGENVPSRYDTALGHRDGSRVDVEFNTGLITYHDQLAELVVIRDITERKQAEGALRNATTILNTIIDGIIILDMMGTILDINESVTHLFGHSHSEVIGKQGELFVTDENRSRFHRELQEVMAGESLGFTEHTVKHQDGSISPVSMSLSLMRGLEGDPTGIILVLRDITERKQAEEALRESEKRLRTLADLLPQTVYEADREGRISFFNRTAFDTFGYSQEDFEDGLTIMQLFTPEDQGRVEEDWKTVLSGKGLANDEYIAQRKDRSAFPATMHSSRLIHDDEVVGTTGIIIDSTRQKEMEQALDEYSVILEQKIVELQDAYSELQELDRMKDSFLSTVSHELRTPLTSIKSFAEILLTYEDDKETQKEFLAIINDESDRLTRLINDLLDLAKIEAGRVQWQTDRVIIAEVIQTAVNATYALATQKTLHVNLDLQPDLPPFWGDRDRLVQVVTNLLSNAIKFTPVGGTIRIATLLLEGNELKGIPDMARVSVSDSGIGIASDDLDKVFEKFRQVGDTLTEKPQGTGLGLPICKEIVENYGGRIWAESVMNSGSTFHFTLPVLEIPQKKAVPDITQELEMITSTGE